MGGTDSSAPPIGTQLLSTTNSQFTGTYAEHAMAEVGKLTIRPKMRNQIMRSHRCGAEVR